MITIYFNSITLTLGSYGLSQLYKFPHIRFDGREKQNGRHAVLSSIRNPNLIQLNN